MARPVELRVEVIDLRDEIVDPLVYVLAPLVELEHLFFESANANIALFDRPSLGCVLGAQAMLLSDQRTHGPLESCQVVGMSSRVRNGVTPHHPNSSYGSRNASTRLAARASEIWIFRVRKAPSIQT